MGFRDRRALCAGRQDNDKVKPNPYLAHIANRDLVTSDGTTLTLFNPATILRLMSERYASIYGAKVRITGLKYLNPINAPDAWEIAALKSFEKGKTEASEVRWRGTMLVMRKTQRKA